MKRMAALAMLLWIVLLASALAQDNLYPQLEDELDRAVQRLAVMSQRDEAFEHVKYNDGLLKIRGCLPVSMANSVIAALGVSDRETAIGMVKETAELLVFPKSRGKAAAELRYLPTLMSPQERTAQADKYPFMAETMGRYPGEIRFLEDDLSAEALEEQLSAMESPCMLVGRLEVYPDWTEMIRAAAKLDAMGHGDARILIAYAGAGTESSGAPLRSGESGHYLTLMMNVRSFLEEGRIYVLDSLPRAIEGEESGYTMVLRRPYPFWQDRTDFRKMFVAGRISPTVIRLSLQDPAAWQAADAQEKAKQMNNLIVFGRCVVTIVLNEAEKSE